MRKTKVKSSKNSLFLLKALSFGLISGILVCMLFLILFASVFVKLESIPQNLVRFLALFAASLGAFTAGYIALRIYKEKGLYFGAICGNLVFLIFTIFGLFVKGESLSSFTFIKLLLLTFFGALGGVLGTNKKSRRILK